MGIGRLLLLPNLLDEEGQISAFFPANLGERVSSLQGVFCESEKEARRYLRRFLSHEAMQKVVLVLLNEHTQCSSSLLDPLLKGESWGILSDAGLPCLADPGADLVALAHQKNIVVEPIAGPCSLIFALQLSGFSGQNFSFHGYLPRESEPLEKKLLSLEKRASEETQIWIEAPYRTEKMRQTVCALLQPQTLLCIASSLTTVRQRVLSAPISVWRKDRQAFEKEPAVFLLKRREVL